MCDSAVKEAVHGQMERGVIVFNSLEEFANGNIRVELFFNFAHKSLLQNHHSRAGWRSLSIFCDLKHVSSNPEEPMVDMGEFSGSRIAKAIKRNDSRYRRVALCYN